MHSWAKKTVKIFHKVNVCKTKAYNHYEELKSYILKGTHKNVNKARANQDPIVEPSTCLWYFLINARNGSLDTKLRIMTIILREIRGILMEIVQVVNTNIDSLEYLIPSKDVVLF